MIIFFPSHRNWATIRISGRCRWIRVDKFTSCRGIWRTRPIRRRWGGKMFFAERKKRFSKTQLESSRKRFSKVHRKSIYERRTLLKHCLMSVFSCPDRTTTRLQLVLRSWRWLICRFIEEKSSVWPDFDIWILVQCDQITILWLFWDTQKRYSKCFQMQEQKIPRTW